ncbi:alpha-amylase 3-like isoform X2 [Lycorma delicatula]
MGSSSSSSSVLQDTTAASAQLLNSHHYHNLAGDVTCQENGNIKPTLCGIQLNIRKSQQDYYFVSWNWPLIRKFCFWGVMSMMVACICVVIAYVTTLPTRCDPPRSWYQGSLMYEIFPGSFKDSNDDGIGDINGIILKIDYLRNIGVQSIKLNSIFPSEHYPEHYNNIENLTKIEQTLGTINDFRLLIKKLHENNISVILDIPLYPHFKELNSQDDVSYQKMNNDKKQEYNPNTMTHVILNNHILNSHLNKTGANFQPLETKIKHNWYDNHDRGIITRILQFWLHENVDGFYMKNLENYVDDENFIDQIIEWRSLLHNSKDGFDKVLVCSSRVIDELEKINNDININAKLTTLLTHFSLIDIYIDDIKRIPQLLDYFQKGIILSNPGYPWPLWSSGGIETTRLTSRLQSHNETLAAIALQMMLPGTPSIFYGDELGLDNIHDPNGERSDISHVHSLAPMKWSSSTDGIKSFTHSRMLPWMPEAKVYGPSSGQKVISILSNIRDNNPSIYMHAIWKERVLNSNSAIRYLDDNLILLERSYPRRNTYIILSNVGKSRTVKDLSSIFFGGQVMVDHEGKSGYSITFHKLILNPGEFYVIKLDL